MSQIILIRSLYYDMHESQQASAWAALGCFWDPRFGSSLCTASLQVSHQAGAHLARWWTPAPHLQKQARSKLQPSQLRFYARQLATALGWSAPRPQLTPHV